MNIQVAPKEGFKEQLTIFIDGEAWRDIHFAIFGRRPSLPSSCSSWEEWKQIFQELEEKQVRQYVLRRLASQHYHSQQLKKLLAGRLVSSPLIAKVIKDYMALGYLNDEMWIESFIRGHSKRHSRRAILTKLQSKGVPTEQVEDLLSQFVDVEGEIQKALKLLKTRYRSKNLKDPAEKRKVIAALLRKGFPFDCVKQALIRAAN